MMDERKSASGATTLLREPGAREFTFSAADFERVRKLIYEHAGISLSATKEDNGKNSLTP